MIACTVQWHYSCLLVTFPNGKTLLIQSDWDIARFAYDCGLLKTDLPSDPNYSAIDIPNAVECPDEYLNLAE